MGAIPTPWKKDLTCHFYDIAGSFVHVSYTRLKVSTCANLKGAAFETLMARAQTKLLIPPRDSRARPLLISMLYEEDKMEGWRCGGRLGSLRVFKTNHSQHLFPLLKGIASEQANKILIFSVRVFESVWACTPTWQKAPEKVKVNRIVLCSVLCAWIGVVCLGRAFCIPPPRENSLLLICPCVSQREVKAIFKSHL